MREETGCAACSLAILREFIGGGTVSLPVANDQKIARYDPSYNPDIQTDFNSYNLRAQSVRRGPSPLSTGMELLVMLRRWLLGIGFSIALVCTALGAEARPQTDVRLWYQPITQVFDLHAEVPETAFTVDVPHGYEHVSGDSIFWLTYAYDVAQVLPATGLDMRFVLDGEQQGSCRWVHTFNGLEKDRITGEVRCQAPEFLSGTHTIQIFNDGTPDSAAQGQTTILLMQVEQVRLEGGPQTAGLLGFGGAFAAGAVLLLALELPLLLWWRSARSAPRDPGPEVPRPVPREPGVHWPGTPGTANDPWAL